MKNTTWRVSSNITPSKIDSSESGRIFFSRASAIAPKPTNESVHSPNPNTRNSSGEIGASAMSSGGASMP